MAISTHRQALLRRAIVASLYAWGVWLCATQAWAQAGLLQVGERVERWTVVREERHSAYVRYYFGATNAAEVGVEIVADAGPPSAWSTGALRIMPAPGTDPPVELLRAVMQRLKKSGDGAATAPWVLVRLLGRDSALGAGLVGALLAAWLMSNAGARARRRLGDAAAHAAAPALLLLVGLAALERVRHLPAPFPDDAQTQRLFIGMLDVGALLRQEYLDQRHPPLFYLVLHAALQFGQSEMVAKLPALLFWLLTIAASYVAARGALGKWPALGVATLVAANPTLAVHAVEVSDVTLFTFLTVASTHVLLTTLQDPGRPRLVALLLLEVALGYAYFLAPLVTGCHLLVVLLASSAPGRRRALAVLAVALACWLPVMRLLWRLVADDRGMRVRADAFPTHLWGQHTFASIARPLLAMIATGWLAWAVLAGVGVAIARWRREGRREQLGVWMALIGAGFVGVALASSEVRMKPYYAAFIVPAVAYVTTYGWLGSTFARTEQVAAERGATVRLRALASASAVGLYFAIVAGHGFVGWARYSAGPAPNAGDAYRALGAHLRAHTGPRHLVADPSYMYTHLLYYTFDDPARAYRACTGQVPAMSTDRRFAVRCRGAQRSLTTLTEVATLTPGWEDRSVDALRSLGEPTRVVYSVTFPNPRLLEHLRSACRLEAELGAFRNLSLFVCPANAAG